MIISSIALFKKQIGRGARLLGLDIGDKTFGIAISDPDWKVASPVETLRRTSWAKDSANLLRIIDERAVKGIAIGWPLNMDGSEGKRCQSTRHIAKNILKLRDIPILFWDERLSSWAMEQEMIEADVSRAKRAKAIDMLAAAFILQGVLDRLHA